MNEIVLKKEFEIRETLPVIEKGTDVLKSEPNVLVRVFIACVSSSLYSLA